MTNQPEKKTKNSKLVTIIALAFIYYSGYLNLKDANNNSDNLSLYLGYACIFIAVIGTAAFLFNSLIKDKNKA